MWLPVVQRYTLLALEGTPDVLAGLLKNLPADSPLWDESPDPERFTLREMLAHLADWEPIWKERVARTLAEDKPFLPNKDENQMAIDHDYAKQDPLANLARFRAGREAFIALLKTISEGDWERTAMREGIGEMSLDSMASMILAHDGYHTRQSADWIKS